MTTASNSSKGWDLTDKDSNPTKAAFQHPKSREARAGDDTWGFSAGSGCEILSTYSELEEQRVMARNGRRRFMTTVPDFTALLARMGVHGPSNIVKPGLDRRGTKIGAGAQFTVFEDKTSSEYRDMVIKRINVFEAVEDDAKGSDDDYEKEELLRRQLRIVEVEMLALCHPPLRDHRNIVKLLGWGFDFREDSASLRVPVLYMEKALASLSSFLVAVPLPKDHRQTVLHHVCLDVGEGLAELHRHGIVHGDVKPDNVLVFHQHRQHRHQVPFVAKLSDFGMCLALEESSGNAPTSFAVYRATPHWRPPEADKYDEKLHGPFRPELLFKCDAFSYALLVLSVMATRGEQPLRRAAMGSVAATSGTHRAIWTPSRLASSLAWSSRQLPQADSSNADADCPERNRLNLALAVLGKASDIQEPLRSRISALLSSLLKERPRDRGIVASSALNDDSIGYRNWLCLKDVQPTTPTSKGLFKSMSWLRGFNYWVRVNPILLDELHLRYTQLEAVGKSPRFPAETLFGMAVGYATIVRTGRGDRENVDRVLKYTTAAALQEFFPAQAVCERLYTAHKRDLPIELSSAVRLNWLSNAASTGSLFAQELLAERDPAAYATARQRFRRSGGYNEKHLNTLYARARDVADEDSIGAIWGSDARSIDSVIVDTAGNRLIHVASMAGNAAAVESLVLRYSADVNARNDDGETPLLLACKAGHADVVKVLVNSGADGSIFSQNPYSVGPLHWLFNFDRDDIANIGRLLVEKAHAPVNRRLVPTRGEADPVAAGAVPAPHFPFEWPYGTPLHWAVFARNRAAIDILCELGADLDATDLEFGPNGQTALSMAANRLDHQIVEYLVRKGACPTAVDGKGRSALHLLSLDTWEWKRGLQMWRGFQDWILCGTWEEHLQRAFACVETLLAAGCQLEAKGHQESSLTPLFYASYNLWPGACGVTCALLHRGAQVDGTHSHSSIRWSLLQCWATAIPATLAYRDGFERVIEAVVARTGNLNEQNALGETALHKFMENRYLSKEQIQFVMKLLWTQDRPSRLDVNIKTKHGKTPMHYAVSNYGGGVDGIALLVESMIGYGADLTTQDSQGRNSFHLLGENLQLDDLLALEFISRFREHLTETAFFRMINQPDTDNKTPLMCMAESAKLKCMKRLVEAGAKVNAAANRAASLVGGRFTALDFALRTAEFYRQWLLFDKHQCTVGSSMPGGYTFTERSDNMQDMIPQVVRYLRSKGAKMSAELGLRPLAMPPCPKTFDEDIRKRHNIVLETPNEWKFVFTERPPIEDKSHKKWSEILDGFKAHVAKKAME